MRELKEERKDKKKKKEKKERKKEGKAVRDSKELVGGWDFKAGNGPGAQKGQSIKMRYVGEPSDGKVFDFNTQGKPVSPSL